MSRRHFRRAGKTALLIGLAIALATMSGAADEDIAESAEEIFRRPVSLSTTDLPLRQALRQVASAAALHLTLDFEALAETELDLDEPVTVTLRDEPLGDALAQLIEWNAHPGVFREVRNGELHISTIDASLKRTAAALPDWLQAVHGKGLLATLDDDNQVVSISSSDKLTDELLARFPSLPRLRELTIGGARKLTPDGLSALANLPALESLNVHDLQHGPQWLGDAVIEQIIELKTLRRLSLNECGTTDAGIGLLEQMPQLTHLKIYQEDKLTDAAVASIAKLKNLKLLSLNNYVSTPLGKMQFTKEATNLLAAIPQIEHLHLVGHEVSAATLRYHRLKSLSLGEIVVNDECAARIAECRELQSLSLCYTGITDEGLRRISDLPDLRRLDLDSLYITDAGIAHLTRLSKLSHISLRCSQLTDKSLVHLAEIKSLERIDLDGSGQPGFHPGDCFTAVGLIHLKDLPKLRSLWLTNFDSEGFSDLKQLSQLRELHMLMVDIRQDEYQALEDAMPKTRLTHMTGGGGFSMFPKKKRLTIEPRTK